MSLPSNSVLHMAQALRTGTEQETETFHEFFECWLAEQNQHLEELVSASKELEANTRTDRTNQEQEERRLVALIDRVIKHYEHYYNAKSMWANQDVLGMLNPSWRSSLEDAFLWIGGWRPSMAFHLLYSKTGLQLEARLAELISGLTSGDLGDLSSSQLNQEDELQRKTIREEKEISEKQAKYQEAVADTSMVQLSHAVTELIRAGETSQDRVGVEEQQVESTLASKEDGLVEILQMADDLRLRTLRELINILNPIQAVHFLIAAAELHLRIHDWGKKRDAMHHRVGRNAYA